jgi:hypothetical protein
MDLSAPGSHFNHAIMNGDFKRHFNDQELLEMSVYIREPELSYADSFDTVHMENVSCTCYVQTIL